MTSTRYLALFALSFLLAGAAAAQTSTWTGFGNLATFGDWNNAANWDTGAVPNHPAGTVVINQATPAYRNFPDGPYVNANPAQPAAVTGGALPIITGAVSLGQLRFDLPAVISSSRAALYVGTPGGATGDLIIGGAGVELNSSTSLPADLTITSGSSLTLAGQARFVRPGQGQLNLYLSESTATAANPARLLVRDDATLDTPGVRWLTVYGQGAASLVFQDRARTGQSSFQLGNNTTVEFHNTASASGASFRLGANSLLLFDGDSTAGQSTVSIAGNNYAPNAVIVRFAGRSSAGVTAISSGNTNLGALEFTEQATGGPGLSFYGRRLDISGAATAGGATGRQRAGTSGLAPVSVVAGDARTIVINTLTATDVLLGSNTLEVGSGWIFNLCDSGGAYLSAAGENLVGGGLVKTGTGTLTLSGPNYGYDPVNGYQPFYNVVSGPSVVRGGTLVLYNRLADLTVESAGTLTGSGIVAGRLVNQGRVNSTATVTGDYVQSAAATYVPNITSLAPPGFPVKYGLTVTGNASLAGTLAVAVHPNIFAGWKPAVAEVPVLTAGSITGRFASLDTSANPARIRADAGYTGTAVNLRLELLPFAALGATPGARAFGAYLDRAYQYTGRYFPTNYNWLGDALTFAPDATQAAATLADLAPDRYGAAMEHGFATALARRPALDRLAGGNQSVPAGPRGELVAEGGRRRLTYAAVDGLPRAAASTSGWLAGGRTRWGGWSAGAYVATERTDLRLDDTGSSARINSVEPGAFLRLDHGRWFAHASAAFSTDRYELTRVSRFTAGFNVESIHAAKPYGRRTDLGLTAGGTWSGRGWNLSPFAGLLVSRWRLDDFTETSSRPTFPYDSLAVEGWTQTSRRARAGLAATGSWLQGRLAPRLTVTRWHEFNAERSIPVRLPGATGPGYLAPGRPSDRDTWQAALDLAVRLPHGGWFTLGGSLQRGELTRSSADYTAGLRWEF